MFFIALLQVVMWTYQSTIMQEIEAAPSSPSEIVKFALQRKNTYKNKQNYFSASDQCSALVMF